MSLQHSHPSGSHQSRSQNLQSSQRISQFAPRPFSVQGSQHSPTQEEIENQAFDQDKFAATGLQLKEKYGTITPLEQKRLSALQADMNSFWTQRLERTKVQPNLLDNILIGNSEATSASQVTAPQATAPQATTFIQPKLAIHQLGGTVATPISALPLQPKLTIGRPNDLYEQEADRVAKQIMSMAPPVTPHIQRQIKDDELEKIQTKLLVETTTPIVQRQKDLEDKEPIQAKCEAYQEEQIQRFASGSSQAQPDLESRLNASKGGGIPLPDEVRSFMEPRFGADFRQVRVHTDRNAVQMNRELGAQAFTHGSHIYYGAGKTPANDQLTGHELTHVVQQNERGFLGIDRQQIQTTTQKVRMPNLQAHFSDRYARWSMMPHEYQSGQPESYSIHFTLDVALEVNLMEEEVDSDVVQDLIQSVLNAHAGGLRQINGRNVYISWNLRWTTPSRVRSGTALGISLFPAEIMEGISPEERGASDTAEGQSSASSPDGIFLNEGEISRIVLRGSYAQRAIQSRSRRERTRSRRLFGNEVTHEIGHSLGLRHQTGTVMALRNSTRLDRQLSNDQIREIMIRLRGDEESQLPEWMRTQATEQETQVHRQVLENGDLWSNIARSSTSTGQEANLQAKQLDITTNGSIPQIQLQHENNPDLLQRARTVETLLELYVSSSDLLFLDVDSEARPSYTRAWINGNSSVIQAEINRRLDIKLNRGEEEHLAWYLRYLDQIQNRNTERERWLREAINDRLQLLLRGQTQENPMTGFRHERYIDNFLRAVVPINDADDPRNYSRDTLAGQFHVIYEDGTNLTLNIDQIGDEDIHFQMPQESSGDTPLENFFYIGDAGRVFPRTLCRGSAPRLWQVKQQVLQTIEQMHAATLLIINMALVATDLVITPGPIGSFPTARYSRRVSGRRFLRTSYSFSFASEEVWHYEGRDIVVLNTSGGPQPFYRRTGLGSGGTSHAGAQAGDWAPFDGFIAGHFDKARFTAGIPEHSPLFRYGTEELLNGGGWLSSQNLPRGRDVGDNWAIIQRAFEEVGVRVRVSTRNR